MINIKNNKGLIIKGALTLFISFIFVQSLFFKFTNAPETQHIFGTLNDWATGTFGVENLFLAPGIFNQYVVGSAELVASVLLLLGLFTKVKILNPLGALVAFGVISGAVSVSYTHLTLPTKRIV